MSITLTRELEQIESDIKSAIIGGESFQYQKLLRMKSETLDKLFFAETRSLRVAIESATTKRQAAIAQKSELETALTDAANVVLEARGRLFDAEQEYQRIGTFIFYAETQIEEKRKSIRELQGRLDSHVQSKLNSGDSPQMETLTNETTY